MHSLQDYQGDSDGSDTENVPSNSESNVRRRMSNNVDWLNSGVQQPPPEAMPYVQALQQTMQMFMQHLEQRGQNSTTASNARYSEVSNTTAAIKPDARFRLTAFDPDDDAHTIVEWLDDVTKIKDRLSIDESWMIVRCADALKGRALNFYNHWRPVDRNWENFVTDFKNAFPDGETHGTRMVRAANLKSGDFKTLTEYVLTKIRFLKRFLITLSWDHILSCVVTGLECQSARDLVQARNPENQQSLLQLLGQYEAEKSLASRHLDRANERSFKRTQFNPSGRDAKVQRRDHSPRRDSSNKSGSNRLHEKALSFRGNCFRCGKRGHRESECWRQGNSHNKNHQESTRMSVSNQPEVCDFCKKKGHAEDECYRKQKEKPKIVQCVQPVRSIYKTPIATILLEGKASTLSYWIDTGAEVSLIRESTVQRLNIPISSDQTALDTVGATVNSRGRCLLFLALPSIVLEVQFLVLSDTLLPGVADALIGLDVIQRPGLELVKTNGCIDLCYNNSYVPIVGAITKSNEISIDLSGLAEAEQIKLLNLLKESQNKTAPFIKTGELKVKLIDPTPVCYRPRRLAYAERTRVKTLIDEMLKQGTIKESHSEYASPIVLVAKRDGSLRLCVDYRDINKKVAKDCYPIPRIQDQIDALYKYRYFSILDMKAGFHQMKIEEQSKHLFAFITPDGHYEFNVMPFGYVNSPACYQRAIDKALGNLKNSIAFVYIDDVLCPAENLDEAFEKLSMVLDALATAGFSLNYEKCRFFQQTVEYLGLLIGNGCVRPSPSKVTALAKSTPPQDKRGVRQFLGLASYFRRFIRNFATKVAPITALLRKDAEFEWNDSHELIRQEIIRLLTDKPVLIIFNPEVEVELHTDACSSGIGGMLLQKFNNILHPVAYFSRRTTDYESRYHSYDLETLAIVEAAQYFRAYLYGRHFMVFTDCSAVRATALKKDMHPRVARWWMKLQEFDFDIEYRPGHKMTHVDYLSRNPVTRRVVDRSKLNEPLLSIKTYQTADEICQKAVQGTLPTSEQHQYRVENGIVYRVLGSTKSLRCYVPERARLRILKAYHDESTHIGAGKMVAKLKEILYWPRMQKGVRKYVDNCRACAIGKSHTGRRHGLYQLGEKASGPLDIWHVDHAGPLVRSRGYSQILVLIDEFSKFCKLIPVSKKTAHDSIVALDNIFAVLGVPRKLTADRGTAFSARDFCEFVEAFGCELHLVATGVPRGNGVVERLMRTIFNLMRSTLTADKENTWTDVLSQIEDNINNTVSTSTGFTPRVLMCGKNDRLCATEPLLQHVQQPAVDLATATETARQHLADNCQQTIDRLNQHRQPTGDFAVGDKVLIEDTQAPSRGKLGARYKGPFVIKQLLPNDRYCLGRGGKRETVAARDQLRLWPDANVKLDL